MLLAAFLGAALLVYRPALDGPFVSDDMHYVARNAYVHQLSAENLLAILDPFGPATVAVVNYTPVHLFLHTLAWEAFGSEVRGHHLVNVALHCIASLLLVALFTRSGIPRLGAVLGAVFFLLHPANVEAVAWINQLKSSSALVLSLAALLAVPRRPGLGSALFALSLLAKPTAAYALPVAFLLEWAREGRVRWKWLALWSGIFAAYAFAEFVAHQRSGAAEAILYETPWVLLRTVVSLALRYLVMAATSYGVSTFHEPDPVYSALDPWWLCSLVVLGLLGWRAVVALRARGPEFAYWCWALVSYAPISQIFPFLYPMADRYLYFILPGLIGGVLLAARDGAERLRRSGLRAGIGWAGVAVGVAAAVFFGVRSSGRAAVWRSPARIVADSAEHYPNGVSANLLRAKRAVLAGDVDAVAAALRAAVERGYKRFDQLLTDPDFAPVRNHPRFRAVVEEIAAGWIERGREIEDPTQLELRLIGNAHYARGEYAEAAEVLRRALAIGGVEDAAIREELEALAFQ